MVGETLPQPWHLREATLFYPCFNHVAHTVSDLPAPESFQRKSLFLLPVQSVANLVNTLSSYDFFSLQSDALFYLPASLVPSCRNPPFPCVDSGARCAGAFLFPEQVYPPFRPRSASALLDHRRYTASALMTSPFP